MLAHHLRAAFLFFFFCYGQVNGRLSDYVDLFIGTEGATPGSSIASGNVFPGAALPNGMAKVGIDTSYTGLGALAVDANAGYSPLGNVTGVSMLHVTGTGGNPTCRHTLVMDPLLHFDFEQITDGRYRRTHLPNAFDRDIGVDQHRRQHHLRPKSLTGERECCCRSL